MKKQKRSRTPGRPTKLTREIQEAIVAQLKGGNFFAVACRLAGVSEATGKEWLARGEGADPKRTACPPYVGFAAAIRKAEARGETASLQRVQKSINADPKRPDGRLALEFLTRRFPERWGRSRMEHTGKDGTIIEVRQTGTVEAAVSPRVIAMATIFTDEELNTILERVAHPSGPGKPDTAGSPTNPGVPAPKYAVGASSPGI